MLLKPEAWKIAELAIRQRLQSSEGGDEARAFYDHWLEFFEGIPKGYLLNVTVCPPEQINHIVNTAELRAEWERLHGKVVLLPTNNQYDAILKANVKLHTERDLAIKTSKAYMEVIKILCASIGEKDKPDVETE